MQIDGCVKFYLIKPHRLLRLFHIAQLWVLQFLSDLLIIAPSFSACLGASIMALIVAAVIVASAIMRRGHTNDTLISHLHQTLS